ncbi:hypothetical protein [Paenirhodobacter enshiensis]|uniref:hypothetical protein n=1 Tax=Paenirhodobacter enshiensis TaxID=1105367 RepID=UPI0035B36817
MTEERDPMQAINAARDMQGDVKDMLELIQLAGNGEGGPTGAAITRSAIVGQEALTLAEGALETAAVMLMERAAA